MISPEGNYRQTLKGEFGIRCRKNPRYTLRAFARFLGLAPAVLSDVLNRKYGISSQKGALLAQRLGYSKRDTELFCALIEKEHGRSRSRREAAAHRLEKFRSPGTYDSLERDSFDVISQWYHFPIVELARTQGFRSDPAWIGKRLGISVINADLAIARLTRLGLLKVQDGSLVPSQDFYGSSPGVPSEARRNFHAQILKKAAEALVFQPFEKRTITASVIAVDSTSVAMVRELAEEFRLKVDAILQSASVKDAVYCLGVQFFELGEPVHGQ